MSDQKPVSEELHLLREMNGKLDGIQTQIKEVEQRAIKNAIVYGAAAGGVSGALVSCGVLFARAKLGL